MRIIKDWAEFYRERRLWVYPYNLKEKEWTYWKSINNTADYEQLFNGWAWNESTGIKLVVGKKGIRVVEVTNKELLKRALQLLRLSEAYSWIIYSPSRYGIVIDTPGVSLRTKGITNKSFRQVLLLWNGYYVLPSTGVPRYFYNNRIPQGHPKQIADDVLLDCMEAIISI